jgi:hypothetical protein
MFYPDNLRAGAARCLAAAEKVTGADVRDTLIQLASRYLERAQEQEVRIPRPRECPILRRPL